MRRVLEYPRSRKNLERTYMGKRKGRQIENSRVGKRERVVELAIADCQHVTVNGRFS